MTNEPSSKELRALLKSVGDAGWDYAHIEMDGLTLVVSNDPQFTIDASGQQPTAQTPPVAAAPAPTTTAKVDRSAPAQPAAAAQELDELDGADFATVGSPSIGLFWRSPKPGAPPFVEVGQQVTAEDTVCIVEVMKLMTHVRAGHAGTVARIRPQNGSMVEFGTPLIDITP